jgi:hypothetical protein
MIWAPSVREAKPNPGRPPASGSITDHLGDTLSISVPVRSAGQPQSLATTGCANLPGGSPCDTGHPVTNRCLGRPCAALAAGLRVPAQPPASARHRRTSFHLQWWRSLTMRMTRHQAKLPSMPVQRSGTRLETRLACGTRLACATDRDDISQWPGPASTGCRLSQREDPELFFRRRMFRPHVCPLACRPGRTASAEEPSGNDPSGRKVSGPSCPSTPGRTRVAVDEDEHGGPDRETDNNDHP